jgi:hypothetical protein
LHIPHSVGAVMDPVAPTTETKEPITVTPIEIIYHRRVRVLEHAAKTGNVAETCRTFGISRKTFYGWKNLAEAYGLEALVAELVAAAEPGLVASTGPRYFGFVTGGSIDAVLGADLVLVHFDRDSCTDRVVELVQAEGTCWCGAATWQGRRVMRISVSSWATTDADVDRSADAMLRAFARARTEAP